MKTIRLIIHPVILSVLMAITLPGCTSSKEENVAIEPMKHDDHVEVIYFYGDMRCLTCRAIEKYAKETVDSIFRKEKESGLVSFRSIDINSNEALAASYQTTGSSLFVTSFLDGEEMREDITAFGFKTARKKHDLFQDSLAMTVRKHLKEMEK